jgi:hypothetical protein
VQHKFYWTSSDGGKTFAVHDNAEMIIWMVPHATLPDVALGFSYVPKPSTCMSSSSSYPSSSSFEKALIALARLQT